MLDERALLVPLQHLQPGPNSRSDWQIQDEPLERLKQSIRELGILEPLVVRELHGGQASHQYQIICGHRRFLAAQQLNLTLVPIRKLSIGEDRALALSLAENIARKTIGEQDIVKSIEVLTQTYGWTNRAITRATGLSKGWVSELMTVARSKQERKAVERGQIGITTAARIIRTKDQPAYKTLIKRVESGERIRNGDVPRVRRLQASPLVSPMPGVSLETGAVSVTAGVVLEPSHDVAFRMVLDLPGGLLNRVYGVRRELQEIARELRQLQSEQGQGVLPGQLKLELEAARNTLEAVLSSFAIATPAG